MVKRQTGLKKTITPNNQISLEVFETSLSFFHFDISLLATYCNEQTSGFNIKFTDTAYD